jgi:hypothetical protein
MRKSIEWGFPSINFLTPYSSFLTRLLPPVLIHELDQLVIHRLGLRIA